jgi:hypothetical protein
MHELSDMSNPDTRLRDPELAATDKPSGGGMSEDWLATLVGLALVVIAFFGLIPKAVLW